jgi:hypothetical protein
VITAVGDKAITSNTELIEAKNSYKAGDVVNFTVFRGGKSLVIPVTLEEQNSVNTKVLEDYVQKKSEEAAKNQPQYEELPPEQNEGNFPFPFF